MGVRARLATLGSCKRGFVETVAGLAVGSLRLTQQSLLLVLDTEREALLQARRDDKGQGISSQKENVEQEQRILYGVQMSPSLIILC